MNRFGLLGVALLSLVASTGCTRSITLTYKPGISLNKAVKSSPAQIGVVRFEDKRAWVKPGDRETESFIASQDPWKFGLGYKGKEYIPVNELVQQLFVEEFKRGGFNVQALDNHGKFDEDALQQLGKERQLDYVLSGKILSFEFANDAGLVTVDSRRTVALSLDILRVDGKTPTTSQLFTETMNENEGLGVLHSTNADKLVNDVFKKVLGQVILKVSNQLEVDAKNVALQVRIDGVEHPVLASALLE
ncbi:hypothetical protein [Archangium sp.]|uniref:hypothetical protein n=1 Tax=Archangium sp. TaxID=1872627 RepID=UPI002D6588F4|nr:hypothetical protein [Archangium sp.]HYO56157.1 hypothetical protein [Archangium sp.]